jgi:hypothetical protein
MNLMHSQAIFRNVNFVQFDLELPKDQDKLA